ncbi:MAG: glutamate-5-semialdehyde dehydrogenase [Anaerolineae bacterium]|nr:glutamate-5-semialdehyde dehydrogenase [Anaerolineae bacterium]
MKLLEMGKRAKEAAFQLANFSTEQKNQALIAIADALEANTPTILEQNKIDIERAHENGTDPIWIRDRIDLERRMAGIIQDVRNVVNLPDPVGTTFAENSLDTGIDIHKVRVPLGVLGVIYESRPNVTVDISTLALKAGNAVILRGGSDVINTNLEVVRVLTEALVSAGLPEDTMQYIASTDRRYVGEMLKMHDSIDMIIPRGGSGLHNFCRENSTIPVIIGGMGIVHYYVDESANQEKSLPVIYNAKTQRPAVCNSVDTLLVHESIAHEFLPKVVDDLTRADVVFKADEQTLAIIGENDRVSPVAEGDFDTEWMGLTLNLKVVSDVDDAIDHIRQHTTFHSDGILTEDAEQAAYFLNRVDSAAVFWNASTRFNDGSALGLGAEVAISTQKLHARGPMALEELTTYKWVVTGNYTSRP